MYIAHEIILNYRKLYLR